MDTRIYEPVGGGKVTMYYAENFSRVLATADIFVDEEMTTATTDEEFMGAFNSGMVLITIDGTIYTVESVASPDGGSISITINTDTSGAKYTVYYVAEASMVPGAELELTEIFKDRNLTTAVTMSEFVIAVNSGTVMLFHTSGAYEYHTTIRQVKRVGNTVTVIPDIEEQSSSTVIVYTSGTADESGNVEGFAYKNAEMTEAFTSPELKNAFIDGCIINVRLAEPDMFFGLLRPNLYQESEEGSYSTPSVIYGLHGTSTITITAIDPEVS